MQIERRRSSQYSLRQLNTSPSFPSEDFVGIFSRRANRIQHGDFAETKVVSDEEQMDE
jgi:hypothetical protein